MNGEDFKQKISAFLSKLRARPIWQLALGSMLIFFITIILLHQTLRFITFMEWPSDLPSKQELSKIQNPIASELYAAEGELIGKYFVQNRSHLESDDINDHFKHALIATEDRRFYEHSGVDTRSLFRVFFKTILFQRESSGGGSTITQQLVKNLYPRKRYKLLSTLMNKYREMAIARDLESLYTKDDIIALYANTVSFGEQAFGLTTAANRFFNKQPKELLIEEAATLVGILKATSYYSPRNYPERAKQRRNLVLDLMLKNEYITEDVAINLKSLPLNLNYQSKTERIELARYFKEYVRKEFNEWSLSVSKSDGSKYDIEKDGLKIYSSLDYDLQIAAEKIMQSNMSSLQERFLKSWEGGKIFGPNSKIIDDGIFADFEYKSLRKKGLSNKEAIDKMATHKMREFWSWDGYNEKSRTRIDSIKHYLGLLHTGILATNPNDGQIKIWVGGNDYSEFQWDNITAPRQVGSTFKPIVYLTALEKGIKPCDYYENELRSYSDYDDWTPKNSNGIYGGYTSVKGGLTNSINTVSVQLLFEAGIDQVVNRAKELGIESQLSAVPSIVLGTSDISLLEMVRAYGTFASGGYQVPLHSIIKIEDLKGDVIFEKENETTDRIQIINEDVIFQLDEMLKNVTQKGTAARLYDWFDIPFEVGGKTGTTQNQSDGWFIGYTSDLVIGSWVGAQDRRIHFRNLSTGSGGRTALPMVGALFEYAHETGKITHHRDFKQITSCPDTLSEREYAYMQRRSKYYDDPFDAPKNIFDLIFGKKKNSRDRSLRQRQLSEKRQRIKEYEKAIKEWERKLQELKREIDKQN
jgi:penicillin-binding protein 1A